MKWNPCVGESSFGLLITINGPTLCRRRKIIEERAGQSGIGTLPVLGHHWGETINNALPIPSLT